MATAKTGTKTTRYEYNADGLRTRKTNADGTSVDYFIVNGTTVAERWNYANGSEYFTMRYTFDENGSVIGFSTHYPNFVAGYWEDYLFAKNLQGDVVAMYLITVEPPRLIATYEYDEWGKVTAVRDANGAILTNPAHLANRNPFRYRGYHYDTETGFYYLQSRYYDPAISRFINADSYGSTGQGFLGTNMFAYCNNNPIKYADYPGTLMVSVTEESEGNWKILNQIFEDATGHGVPVPMEQHVWEDAVAVIIHVEVQENVGYENSALLSREEAMFWTVAGIAATIGGIVAAIPTGGTSLALTGLGYASTGIGAFSTTVGAIGQFTADDIETAPAGYRKYTVTMSYLFEVHTHESSDSIGWKNFVTKKYVYYYSPSHQTLYDGNKKSYLGWTNKRY